ncbi:MAG: hypothetical protein RQ863_06710 [Sulfolobales archaeon]|nr:hypothetical protein [Sulfolobales archaeon]
MQARPERYRLIYYYVLALLLSGPCRDSEKQFCCIRQESLNKILEFFTLIFNKKSNEIKISLNSFKSIINEFENYRIIDAVLVEGTFRSQGYKRYIIIYDGPKILLLKKALENIINKDFKEPVIEALSDVKKDREIYFKDFSLESEECRRLLSNAGRRMSGFW